MRASFHSFQVCWVLKICSAASNLKAYILKLNLTTSEECSRWSFTNGNYFWKVSKTNTISVKYFPKQSAYWFFGLLLTTDAQPNFEKTSFYRNAWGNRNKIFPIWSFESAATYTNFWEFPVFFEPYHEFGFWSLNPHFSNFGPNFRDKANIFLKKL